MTENRESKHTDFTGVIIGALLLPFYGLFVYLDKPDMGRSVFIFGGVLLVAIRVFWKLRDRLWFWGSTILLLALHVPLILLISWPKGWIPAVGMLPIAALDFLIDWGIIRLFEKLTTKQQQSNEAV
ncbi:MAG TPA: hypothetical protein VL967_12905 [Terracidiphilus sp.]|nr:hypothetical protein [Terracidiphilus sp.]